MLELTELLRNALQKLQSNLLTLLFMSSSPSWDGSAAAGSGSGTRTELAFGSQKESLRPRQQAQTRAMYCSSEQGCAKNDGAAAAAAAAGVASSQPSFSSSSSSLRWSTDDDSSELSCSLSSLSSHRSDAGSWNRFPSFSSTWSIAALDARSFWRQRRRLGERATVSLSFQLFFFSELFLSWVFIYSSLWLCGRFIRKWAVFIAVELEQIEDENVAKNAPNLTRLILLGKLLFRHSIFVDEECDKRIKRRICRIVIWDRSVIFVESVLGCWMLHCWILGAFSSIISKETNIKTKLTREIEKGWMIKTQKPLY